jgi:hypothetical protein
MAYVIPFTYRNGHPKLSLFLLGRLWLEGKRGGEGNNCLSCKGWMIFQLEKSPFSIREELSNLLNSIFSTDAGWFYIGFCTRVMAGRSIQTYCFLNPKCLWGVSTGTVEARPGAGLVTLLFGFRLLPWGNRSAFTGGGAINTSLSGTKNR